MSGRGRKAPVAAPGNTDGERPLLVERAAGTAWLTLNRPAAGNALDGALAQALADAAEECAASAEVRCVVLRAAGRLFCAGGDLRAIAAGGNRRQVVTGLAKTLHRAILSLVGMPKALVVVVDGPAAGAGIGLALAGDIVLVSERASFTPSYLPLDLVPDGGLTWLLPRLIGLRRAQEVLLSNATLDAERAISLGLATRLVAHEALDEEACAVVERLAAQPGAGGTKALLWSALWTGFEQQLDREAEAIGEASATAECELQLARLAAGTPH